MSPPTALRLTVFLSLLLTQTAAHRASLSSITTEFYCPIVSRSTLLPGCGSYASAYSSTCAPLFSASKIDEFKSCANSNPAIVALECSCYNELLTCAGTLVSTAAGLGNSICGNAVAPGPVVLTTSSTATGDGSGSSEASPSSVASSTVTSTDAASESSDSASSGSAAATTATSSPEAGTTATQAQPSSTSSSRSSSGAAAGTQPMLGVWCLYIGLVVAALV